MLHVTKQDPYEVWIVEYRIEECFALKMMGRQKDGRENIISAQGVTEKFAYLGRKHQSANFFVDNYFVIISSLHSSF